MKECPACKTSNLNDAESCQHCSLSLRGAAESAPAPKKSTAGSDIITIGVIIALIGGVMWGLDWNSKRQNEPARNPEIEQLLARSRDVQAKLAELNKIKVKDGWTWDIDGEYDYIRGSVVNTGNKPVSYWKVTARFFDKSGAEVDSDITNDGETLMPGAAKRFEIMHRNIPKTTASLEVSEVVFE